MFMLYPIQMRTKSGPLPLERRLFAIVELHRRFLLCGASMLLAILGTMLFGGCQTASRPVAYDPPPEQASVLLQAGDVIKVLFPSSPEMNQSQRIRADGKINLPMIGEVDAAGRTPGSLQAELERRYKPDLTNGQIVVTLESSEMAVYVSGAVNKPGTIVFNRPLSVLEAIMESGGFAYVANTRSVHLIRQSGGQHQTQFIDMRPALSGKPAKVLYLKPGDIIYVPEKAFNF